VIPLVALVESNGPHRQLRVAPLNSTPERAALRQQLRSRRRELGPVRRHAAAQAITDTSPPRAGCAPRARSAVRLGGLEVSTEALRKLARRRRCPVYLPRIVDYRRMPCCSRATTRRSRRSIATASRTGGTETAPVRTLSVVFLPLLGFDGEGARLGSAPATTIACSPIAVTPQWHRPLLVASPMAASGSITSACSAMTYRSMPS